MNTSIHWIAADWPAPPGVIAGCTTRAGGVSNGNFSSLNLAAHVGDDEVSVHENRKRFASRIDLPANPLWLNQVHGTNVAVEPLRASSPTADAMLIRQPQTVCAVMTADCLPVIFASDDGLEIAVAHAGWRGLCEGVLESTVQAFNARPEQILAWLGPAISQEHFEVGSEVRRAFVRHAASADDCFVLNRRGRWQADLYQLARQRLNSAGVRQVSGGEFCTFHYAGRFFSYRRDGQCGRMASFIFRRD
jgi:purine-nucleoside/S-methyl-5'-thioadenosine phosphorylase / adenosine deaminase